MSLVWISCRVLTFQDTTLSENSRISCYYFFSNSRKIYFTENLLAIFNIVNLSCNQNTKQFSIITFSANDLVHQHTFYHQILRMFTNIIIRLSLLLLTTVSVCSINKIAGFKVCLTLLWNIIDYSLHLKYSCILCKHFIAVNRSVMDSRWPYTGHNTTNKNITFITA